MMIFRDGGIVSGRMRYAGVAVPQAGTAGVEDRTQG
jgi:hypothetical protein